MRVSGSIISLRRRAAADLLLESLRWPLRAPSPNARVWVAEPEGHDDWTRSLASGHIEQNAPGTRSICDAILTRAPGEMTFAIGHRLFAGGLVITDAQAKEAMRAAFRYLPELSPNRAVRPRWPRRWHACLKR
jgi:threonine dehydratase